MAKSSGATASRAAAGERPVFGNQPSRAKTKISDLRRRRYIRRQIPRSEAAKVSVWWSTASAIFWAVRSEVDPSFATLAAHCGNGLDGGFSLYQSTQLNR